MQLGSKPQIFLHNIGKEKRTNYDNLEQYGRFKRMLLCWEIIVIDASIKLACRVSWQSN